MEKDTLVLGGQEFTSRFILGSGKYSLDLIKASVENAGAQIITLALRRANVGGTANILDYIPEGVTLLPNTSGARNADEAVRIARLSREVGCGNFVKIEIMRDSKYLLPDNQETIKANRNPCQRGICRNAIYVPGSECSKRPVQCRCGFHHAAGCSDRFQQRTLHERIYPYPD